jgi:septum formation topological specificity factor MinE
MFFNNIAHALQQARQQCVRRLELTTVVYRRRLECNVLEALNVYLLEVISQKF